MNEHNEIKSNKTNEEMKEMKILKILSSYHVWFQNYDRLNYGPFGLDNKPL